MMYSKTALALAAVLPFTSAQTSNGETILGVYMFHRHGDRTSKSTPPTNLTSLGYRQVYTSGQYYRSRYVAQDATLRINGINADVVKQSQIAVSAPNDVVLENSAAAFLQGLYPPVGNTLNVETLGNGTQVQAPLDGYQLIPIAQLATGGGSEDNTWLQSASGCAAATIDSNKYFSSKEYMTLLNSTKSFYQSLSPVVNTTFSSDQLTFKNAYTIYDLINVAEIHNASIQNSSVLNADKLFQLRTLADAHEYGLAYNGTNDMRSVAGKQLAGEVVQFLNGTLTGKGKQKIGVQFGAYATFASFFGLAGLPSVEPNFYGVTDYASAMTFELFTNSTSDITSTNYPSNNAVYVRFLFHNGTTTADSPPKAFPLFGTGQNALLWNDFVNGMDKFAIGSSQQWCTACGNTTGTCAAYTNGGSNSSTSNSNNNGNSNGGSSASSSSGSGNGLSPAVNGVIGAMVTLAVVLGLEALILLVGGFRVVSKKTLAASQAYSNGAAVKA